LDSCRKCSKDLTTHKGQFGIEFLEPVSLGILTFVEGRAAASSAVGGALDTATSHGMGVLIDEERSTEELSSQVTQADDINIDFGGQSTVETPQGSSTDDIGLDMGPGLDNIASDSGFSLNLGDDLEGGGDLNLSFGEDESGTTLGTVEDAGGISLNMEPSGDEGGQVTMTDLDISLADESGGPIVIGGEPSKNSEIELDLDDLGGLEISMDEPTKEPTMKLSAVDAKKAAPKLDDDFADIELSLDDKDLFTDIKDDKGGDIDLGDLDLQIGDDDMGMKF
jgi:hypothetical protein